MARIIVTTATLQLEKGFARKFEAGVIREIKKKIRRIGPAIAKRTENAIQALITLRLSGSEAVSSLAGGELRAQFGLVDGGARIMNMPIASFVTEKGTHLEWLRWLLLEGSAPIVGEYGFKSSFAGRTGQGVMVKKRGKSWSVPAQFQGIEGNNFATQALDGIEFEIQAIIRREFTKAI